MALVALTIAVACRREELPVPPVQRRAPEPPAVVKRAPVTTDRQRYALQDGAFGPETMIVSTYTAPATHDVYLLNCNGAFGVGLQRPVGDQWEHIWSPGMNACMSPPIVIRAGETHQSTVVVQSSVNAAVSSRATEAKIDTGTYRVVWQGLLTSFDPNTPAYGPELPLEQRVSAPIFIQAAPPPDPTRPTHATPPPELRSIAPAHGAQVPPTTRLRVQIAPFFGVPHLYVDREPVENARRGDTFDYAPPRGWTAGRHTVRVVYQTEQRELRWYGWSFTVDGGARQ